jgi:hypothetical protein
MEARLPRDEQLDPQPTRSARRRFMVVAVLITLGLILAGAWVRGGLGVMTERDLIVTPIAQLVLTAIGVVSLRKHVVVNRFGVQMATVFVVATLSVLFHRLIGLHFGASTPQLLAVDMLVLGVESLLAAALSVRWFAGCALVNLVGATVATFAPQWANITWVLALSGTMLIALWGVDKD